MIVSLTNIDCSKISDWESFHNEFNRVFGFPDFYGRNMDAWIDCMTSIDEPDDGMTKIHCKAGRVLTISLENVKELKENHLELYEAIIECAAFVNYRRIETGEQPVLALSFNV